MNTKLKILIAAATAFSAVATPVLADEALEKAIGTRKAQMQLYAFNLGQLGAMAKGAVDHDAATAKAAADNLAALTALNGMAMWPQGSDSTSMPGKTRAKAEAWSTWSAIAEDSKAMVAASANLAAVAGDGFDALRSGIGAVGKGCGGCHKAYPDEE